MKKAILAEILRAVSGLSFLAVLLFLFLIPFFILIQTSDMDAFASMSAAEASTKFYEPVGAAFITVMFLSSYSVTREFYYNSIDHTLIQTGTRRLLTAKVTANAVVGAVLTLVLAIIWALAGMWWLGSQGQSFIVTSSTLAVALSSLLCCVPASLIGCLLGWLVRNYYVTTAVVFLLPLAIEMPLRTIAPEIVRFLPGSAMSGVMGFSTQEGLFPWPASLLVAALWGVVVIVTAWVLERRRDV